MTHPIVNAIANELEHDHPGHDTQADLRHAQNIVDAITRWVYTHIDERLPWEFYADESTQTRPLFQHGVDP